MCAVRVDHHPVDHDGAVARLRRSYAAVPAGEPVRLAKRTSNLFRPRNAPRAPGLDVSGLTGVLDVDPVARTADVQGMCTYEDLVDATLPHGLMPLVVPQLRTITLGGAVTGLGIESTSFRNGLPHESVVEMDVLTGPFPTRSAASATPPGCASSSSRYAASWPCATSASPGWRP
jgi:FAD/FMN-containing dehydrogenase